MLYTDRTRFMRTETLSRSSVFPLVQQVWVHIRTPSTGCMLTSSGLQLSCEASRQHTMGTGNERCTTFIKAMLITPTSRASATGIRDEEMLGDGAGDAIETSVVLMREFSYRPHLTLEWAGRVRAGTCTSGVRSCSRILQAPEVLTVVRENTNIAIT